MYKFWVIFKREYAQVVKRKWFIVSIFLTPLFMVVMTILPAYFAESKATVAERVAVVDRSGADLGQRFVDMIAQYKLEGKDSSSPYYKVTDMIALEPGDSVGAATTLDSMASQINDERVKYCLVIQPWAYTSDTGAVLMTNATSFTTLDRFREQISKILSTKRLELSSVNLSVDSVLNLTAPVHLRIKDTKGEALSFETKYFGGFILVMLMFMMVITYGTQVMRSVIDEKNSRVMEVLVSSVSPFQLMMGKVLGLGAVTFTTVACWIVLGIGVLLMSGPAAAAYSQPIAHFVLNPVVIVFFVLFMIAGYILYSTLFALIGSIVNTEKEAQSMIFPITMSMMLPVILGMSVVQDPNSVLALTLSYIPLFTPTMMIMRIAFMAPSVTHYSFVSGILGQSILAFAVVVIATIFIVWLTGKIFRVGILMYGKRPTLPEIIKWVKY